MTILFETQNSSNLSTLNSRSIPETIDALKRAGYSTQDLARMRHIHVAGTKGKGSVCAFATSILKRYTDVGTFTSPHLTSPRERIALNGEPISQELFTASFFNLWDRYTQSSLAEGKSQDFAHGPDSKPFYFRFLAILAWHIFLQQGIKSVVMECGIGGEHDATNILPADAVSAAVVAQLGIDHVAMLGETVEEIAWHKAGVFKKGVKGFTVASPSQPGVMRVLRSRAEEKGAELIELEEDVLSAWDGVRGILQGDFQKSNQALALLAVKAHLGMDTEPVSSLKSIPDTMVTGLKEARIRGRCEVLQQDNIRWLLDGAHTKESLQQVAKWLAQTIRPNESLSLIFNVQERNITELLTVLMEAIQVETQRPDVVSRAIFTPNEQLAATAEEGDRDLSLQQMGADAMQRLSPSCAVEVCESLSQAIASARESTTKDSSVLVTGSMRLVGTTLLEIEPDALV
ncbi:hypothetical protein VHEMI04982 [[Torrubiella] hemipterigena]|uniref:tetrahydrofolate synthase n=1 Tax=[Torrubiella] hemipterigena TaxID=1531966 RepID=A0A0A1TFF8_9HYPO|nr:hypothetical protein VHEMI04982 [[Torrubiella] hemipterigena]